MMRFTCDEVEKDVLTKFSKSQAYIDRTKNDDKYATKEMHGDLLNENEKMRVRIEAIVNEIDYQIVVAKDKLKGEVNSICTAQLGERFKKYE